MKMQLISIDIGDWSGDGHGKHDEHVFSTNKSPEDIRKAYFKAKDEFPDLCPEKFCEEYEEDHCTEEQTKLLKEANCPFDLSEYPSSRDMAEFTAWFIKKGDADLQLEYVQIPSFHFYGYDEKNRHIGYIGYGLFDF